MIKVGMIIGDRYEILEKIGTGGMSDVYKAKDHKLNRFVAVKVLKQEFSENANFVSKFRIEAQAAAGLMHPNIVNVYDVGEEDGIYFIVMELVEGITLKKYIEKKARLSVKEAVSIAIQVSMGIEAAHNNHIIHRDIKPQNIIISKEGKVKVTDFGIAKAATSNTITSNVMGSVHYTSPEQARGGYSDEKSDIYSLGVTMFEMLTGRVPFNGETTVAIAIKHIQEEMPSPREYVSEIPISVEQIVFKCCQKSPDRRYQSMGELIVDLKRSLMTPDEDFVKVVDSDEEASTRTITDREMVQIKRQSEHRDSMEEAMHLRREKDVQRNAGRRYAVEEEEDEDEEDEEEYEYEYYEEDEEDDEEDDESYSSGMERLTTILAVLAAVLIGCIVLFLVGRAFGLFEFDFPYQESAEYEQGIVMNSSVNPGTMIEEGTNVILTVSSGSEGVEVPDVVGVTRAEGVSSLEQKGFVVNETEGYDQYIKEGSIITQSPEAGTKAPAGTAVTIRISKGVENAKVRVPDIMRVDEMEATSLLIEAGLEPGVVSEVNHEDASLSGLVCYQSYSVGSFVEAGTVVDFSISLGPAQATYRFSEGIPSPTQEEDPKYKAGTLVTVTLTADDGTQLLSTQSSDFPIPQQNITGIKVGTGVILLQYQNVTEASSVTNEDGSVTTTEGSVEDKEIRRVVNFVQE